MAFQSPFLVPAFAATSELLPWMSNAVAAPWRTFKRPSKTSISTPPQLRAVSNKAPNEGSSASRLPALPEFLDSASVGAVQAELQRLRSLTPPPISAMLSQSLKPSSMGSSVFASGARRTLWTMQNAISAAVASPKLSPSRSYSTTSCLHLNSRRAVPRVNGLSRSQQLRFMFGGTSQSLLAHRERTANNNPQSVTAQNAFYSALLQAKMAPIIVERYESGQFASNAYTDSLYAKALDQVGGESTSSHASNTINAEQLQALGQAIASSQQRQNAPSRISVRQENAGANDSRLRVVLEETKPTVALRWVKFLAYFVLTGSIVWVVLNLVLEATGVLNVAQAKKAPIAQQQNQTVRFSDVHGCEQAKEELQELVEFLQNPERFNTLGGKLPKGVLLVGPPGTGKTLLARAVAGEAGVPFFYMSGSEFDEVYVGVGARRVRELFNQARGKAPAIIFIDELDAIGSRRNERDAAYVKQTLNQLLTELDGFSQTSGVIILAATNFPQLLDKALTRPGRFDRKVQVPLPDVRGRVGILNHYLKKVPISTDVDVTVIARGTPGFSGAELENLVNQAAIRASRDKKPKVDPKDFDWAKDKIMMGAENRSLVVRDEDKLMTAYHEAGHALVAYFSPRATPLYKVTIVPRGQALGLTHTLPEMDVVSKDFTQYITDIDVCMGGKAAEQLIYGDDKVTSGCASDLQAATRTAYAMVTRLGFSPKLGNVDLSFNYKDLSPETKQEIEAEVRRLVMEASERATTLLKERRNELELVTKALIEYETLSKAEIEKILRGEKLDKLQSLPKAPITLPDSLLTTPMNPKTNDPVLRDQVSSGQS